MIGVILIFINSCRSFVYHIKLSLSQIHRLNTHLHIFVLLYSKWKHKKIDTGPSVKLKVYLLEYNFELFIANKVCTVFSFAMYTVVAKLV